MPKIRATVKNQFFTHFEMDGMPGKYRISKQLWNSRGIIMMVQGPSWDGNGINGFGKRHLLSTDGGNNAGQPDEKARKILGKRQDGVGAFSRSTKLQTMTDTVAGDAPLNMRDLAVRTSYNEKKANAKSDLQKGYATGAYGPNTPICTFVILDGLTLDEAADKFATALVARNLQEGQDAHVLVDFDEPRVIDARLNGEVDHYYAIEVQVKRHAGIYHIYHCCGAQLPELAVGLTSLFGA